jgi:hypothetical protein
MDGGFSDEITEQLIHGKIRNIKVIYWSYLVIAHDITKALLQV